MPDTSSLLENGNIPRREYIQQNINNLVQRLDTWLNGEEQIDEPEKLANIINQAVDNYNQFLQQGGFFTQELLYYELKELLGELTPEDDQQKNSLQEIADEARSEVNINRIKDWVDNSGIDHNALLQNIDPDKQQFVRMLIGEAGQDERELYQPILSLITELNQILSQWNFSSLLVKLSSANPDIRSDANQKINRLIEKILQENGDEILGKLEEIYTYYFNLACQEGWNMTEEDKLSVGGYLAVMSTELPFKVVQRVVKLGVAQLSQEYYKQKSQLAGEEITHTDRQAPVAETSPTFELEQVYNAVGKVLQELEVGKEVLQKFRRLIQGNISLQSSGAGYTIFRPGEDEVYVLVAVDDTNNMTISEVTALVHELGHWLHAILMKEQQPPINQGWNYVLTESIAILFQHLCLEKIGNGLESSAKQNFEVATIDNGLARMLLNQHAAYTFQTELLEEVAMDKPLTTENVSNIYRKVLKQYWPEDGFPEENQHQWVIMLQILILRFYPFNYMFGQLLAFALLQAYKDEDITNSGIRQLMAAGTSRPILDMLGKLGLDITQQDFWNKAVAKISEKISTLGAGES